MRNRANLSIAPEAAQERPAADHRLEPERSMIDEPPPEAKVKKVVAKGEGNEMGNQERRSEDTAALVETVHSLMLEIKASRLVAEQGGGKRKPWETWVSLCLASIALLGSGISWLGTSGFAVGSTKEQIVQKMQTLEHDLSVERDERKQEHDERVKLQNRFDRLRDLYMVEFGADPEDPNTKVIRKRRN
jgi:hypothetical protein